MVAMLVPMLATIYFYLPSGPVLVIKGVSFTVAYPDSWDTFMWQLSLMLVPAIIACTLLFTLSRSSTPLVLFVLLFELLLLMTFNIDRLLARQQHITGHSYLTAILVTLFVVGTIALVWKRKQKSEREKKEALLKAIDQLTMEDLPELFSSLMDIEITTEEMKETDFVWALKKMLQQNIHEPKVITTKLIQKLTNLKTDNT